MSWLHRIRLRVFAILAALAIGAFGLIAWAAWPVVPVIGFAVLTAAAIVNQVTARMVVPTCSGCGADLSGHEAGTYGVVCPDCGAVNQNLPRGEPTRRA